MYPYKHCLLSLLNNQFFNISKRRFLATSCEELTNQNNIFDSEQKKQKDLVGRIEKIEVHYEGFPESTLLVMNKNISTPFDCAKHLGELLMKRSAVALINQESIWHMHKPIPESCKLELLHYNIPQPALVNKAFWRTCSYLVGAVVTNAFKDNVDVKLHSFPSPNVRTGSFVYDVQLSLNDWKPSQNELKVLSIEMLKYCQKNLPIYCLDVSVDIAMEIFKNNPHKTQQIPDIAAHNGGKITLYRVGEHIDISKGPMVTNTCHLGRISITNVFKLETDIAGGPIYRFQGVALPSSIILNHFAYSLLEERARNMVNPARIPGSQGSLNEDDTFVAKIAI